ncbi:hypothetical protein [Novosphingobium barchaimii]|nr:hypothetical protein [Novosphingobium barchaimii]
MNNPRMMAVATAVFAAGIVNALVYTLGYLAILIVQFAVRGGDGASFGGAVGSLIITLLFTLLISSLITFVLAFPIAAFCRWRGFTGLRSFVIAPAIGAAIACGIASLLAVALTTHLAIISFAYITAASMWLMLGHNAPAARTRTPAVSPV